MPKMYPPIVSDSKMYNKYRKEIIVLKNSLLLSNTILDDNYSQETFLNKLCAPNK